MSVIVIVKYFWQDRDSQKTEWIGRCIEELRSDNWVLPALKQIKEICSLFYEVGVIIMFLSCVEGDVNISCLGLKGWLVIVSYLVFSYYVLKFGWFHFLKLTYIKGEAQWPHG